MTLRVAQIVSPTEAEGPGARLAIWVQGCPLRCPGCCNPEMLGNSGGETIAVSAVVDRIDVDRDKIEGLSLLGGEPFAQAAGLALVAAAARARDLSVMVYSGFTLQQLHARSDEATRLLLDNTDLLVDGPYLREQPDDVRRWIGSRNQELHFLSDRYEPDDPRFRERETIEIRMRDGELIVNGWPAPAELLRRVIPKRGRRD